MAEQLGGNKSAEACRRHYYETYIDVDSFPLPTPAPELANLSIQELKTGSIVPSSAPTHIPKRSNLDQSKSKAVKVEDHADAAGTSQKAKKPRLEEGQAEGLKVKSEPAPLPPPPQPPTTELSHVSRLLHYICYLLLNLY